MKKTTLKFKLRSSRNEADEGVLIIHLTYERKTPTLTTAYRLNPLEWDAKKQEVVLSGNTCSKREAYLKNIQLKLSRDRRAIEKEMEDFRAKGRFTALEILTAFKSKKLHTYLSAFIGKLSESFVKNEQFSTARWYENAGKSFLGFCPGGDIRLDQVTETLLLTYEKYLFKKGLKKNTISNYMRALRATYNTAIRQRIIRGKGSCPFKEVFTGNDKTPKLAIEKSSFLKMHTAYIPLENKVLDLSRDLVMFSFFAQGMNFKDIAYLKKENITRGFIHYKRQKTQQWIRVKIETCMQAIIEKYKEETKNSPFVFPILKETANKESLWKQYQSALSSHNKRLKQLATLSGLDVRLTTYVARHSWATVASSEGIPLSTISRGLGHESIQTTRIYVADTDTSDVIFANEKLLAIFQKTG